MDSIIIPKNYIALTHAADFRHLCQPILDKTEISTCYYIRLYNNGDYFHLSTDMSLNEFMLFDTKGKFHFDIKIVNSMFTHDMFYRDKNKLYLFTDDVNSYWNSLFETFNINCSFNIIEKFDKYYESFWFITSSNISTYKFFVSYRKMLERFVLYFREYGNNLIKLGGQNKIFWLNTNEGYCKVVRNLTEKTSPKKNNCAANLKNTFLLKRYPISNNGIKTYITISELRCLTLLNRGFTCKGIGNILNISHRTVEKHLQNVMGKLDVHTQKQLLRIYRSSSLVNLLYIDD